MTKQALYHLGERKENGTLPKQGRKSFEQIRYTNKKEIKTKAYK